MPRCDHCILEFPERDAVYDEIDGQKKVFCCNGCKGIYRLIHEEGLGSFYNSRKWEVAGISTSLLTKEIDIKPFAEHVIESRGQNEINIYIDGIRCASCVWLNEKVLMKTLGIEYARVNYATHMAKIRWNPKLIGLDGILRRIISIGYIPKPYSESEQFRAQKREIRDLLVRFGTAAFLSSQLMIYSIALYAGYFHGIDPKTKFILEIIAMLLTIPVVFYSGMPFIKTTLMGLRRLNFSMDSLIIIGSVSAFVFSIYQIFIGGEVYFDTSAMIITLILLGRYIEAGAKRKASETIERLIELAPKEARLIRLENRRQNTEDRQRENTEEMVAISSINKGDIVLVKPGERIPIDGIVIGGESEADESIITGESRPIHKTIGSEVIGGSINLYGTLTIEVTRTEKETVLSNIIRAVQDAQASKPRLQRVADRIVGVFVPLIVLISIVTIISYLIMGQATYKALMTGISVLVIACPCSLGLATPIAVLIFTGMASSKGILIRGGEVIENASRLTHSVFDKTGTITIGKPVLKEILVLDHSLNKEYILAVAASIERFSEHSIGHAITEAAKKISNFKFQISDVLGFKAIPGKGVEGIIDNKKILIGNRALMNENNMRVTDFDEVASQFEKSGDTAVYIGWDEGIKGIFVISDVIRDEASNAVDRIRKSGIQVSIISGDNKLTTNSIASMIGIDMAIAEASPVKKREVIANMQDKGYKTMMIGDGINDAPALTQADVSVAMGRGTDIAMESADVVLVRNDLMLIPYFITLSKRAFTIIKQNIFWAFFYNVVAIPLAISGMLHPIIAVSAMAASSLFVVGNSLRIRRYG